MEAGGREQLQERPVQHGQRRKTGCARPLQPSPLGRRVLGSRQRLLAGVESALCKPANHKLADCKEAALAHRADLGQSISCCGIYRCASVWASGARGEASLKIAGLARPHKPALPKVQIHMGFWGQRWSMAPGL